MRIWHGVSAHWRSSGYPASFYTWPVRLLSAQSVSSQASTAQHGWSAEERAERVKSVCVYGIVRLMKLLLTAAHQHIWAARKWLNMTVQTEIEWKPNKSQDVNQFKIKNAFTCFPISAAMPQNTKAEVKASCTNETCLYMDHTHTWSFFSYMTSKSRPWSFILSIPEWRWTRSALVLACEDDIWERKKTFCYVYFI